MIFLVTNWFMVKVAEMQSTPILESVKAAGTCTANRKKRNDNINAL